MFKKSIRYLLLKFGSLVYYNNGSKVLFYHDIHKEKSYCEFSTSLERFQMHIDTIRNSKYEIVDKINRKTHQITIQFDDGYRGIYDCKDFLIKHQIPIEVFIITDYIGKEGYLNENEIKSLKETKLVKFSSHTHTHKKLSQYDFKTIKKELQLSKDILESISGNEIDSICYPYGLFSNEVIRCCSKVGYSHQYSSLPGVYHDLFMKKVRRRNLVQYASKNELKLVLRGALFILNIRHIKQHFKK